VAIVVIKASGAIAVIDSKIVVALVIEHVEARDFLMEYYPEINLLIINTLKRYSIALSGFMKAARMACTHCSRGKPIFTISSIA
jgi:hypothetical protein